MSIVNDCGSTIQRPTGADASTAAPMKRQPKFSIGLPCEPCICNDACNSSLLANISKTITGEEMAFDIIGDIHGQADKLEMLLARLGYQKKFGDWAHPSRQAIFVGDFIDRGPAQLRSVNTVRRMVENGSALAVMGNHEFNAIAWHTPDPHYAGDFLRSHHSPKWGAKNRHQHERFLAEVEHDPEVHAEVIDWFKSLPLWLDLPDIRVIHACWHGRFINWLQAGFVGTDRQLSDALLEPATREPTNEEEKDNADPSLFKAVEALTKGIEIPLPDGHSFHDKDGIERGRVRVRWWDLEARTYRTAAMLPTDVREQLPDIEIPEHAGIGLPDTRPVFFGHYWLTGTPGVLAPTAACVDYSAGKGGALVAYRWDGEGLLRNEKFVSAG
jgi:hypothetical protein